VFKIYVRTERRFIMGATTEFVVADAADAQRVNDQRDSFQRLNANGIDQVRMGTLYALLTGADADPAFMTDPESFAYTASDDGPWVQAVPEDMLLRLAGLSEFDIRRIGDEWSATEEFDPMYSSWTRDDIATFLTNLQALGADAVARQKTLFMWTSL
jgi:hypothetical protein